MLTRHHRLTSGVDFAQAIRRGQRAGTRSLVLHLVLPAGVAAQDSQQVGFVVSKAVGNAVTRNQVKRRLRHLARERLTSLPASAVLVVRALPPAARATYDELGRDFDSALSRAVARGTSGGRPS